MNSKELDKLWDEDPTEAAKIDRRIQKRKNTIQQAQQKLREHQQSQFQELLREEQKKLHLKHPEIADPIKGATVKSNIMGYSKILGRTFATILKCHLAYAPPLAPPITPEIEKSLGILILLRLLGLLRLLKTMNK